MVEKGFTVNDLAHLEEAQDVTYGIYDTQDNCWLGDESGPRLFTRASTEWAKGMPVNLIAKISAQVTGVQMGYAPGRLQAREFNDQNLVLRDKVDTKMTALEALKKIENGD